MSVMRNFRMTFLIVIMGLFLTTNIRSQINTQPKIDQTTFGLGVGMDYGGIGGNILFCPQRNVGLFGGVGYALIGMGYNAGIKFRWLKEQQTTKISPFIFGMYGYNAAIKVSGASEYDRFFYGGTLGIGCDMRSGAERKGYWSFALLLPFRSAEVDDYTSDLENDHGVEFDGKLPPIGISLGYRFILE